jgi:hypothetical protein
MSYSDIAQPDPFPQPSSLRDAALDDPDTFSVLVKWRRSQPYFCWVAVNAKPLGEYHPLQEWPRAELSEGARWLRNLAEMYDADAAAAP